MITAFKSILGSVHGPIQSDLDRAMSVEGHLSRTEAGKLMELAKSAPPDTVVVEIGSYCGRSTISLALGSLSGNRNVVYAVDPHVQFSGIFGGQFGPSDRAQLYTNLARARVGEIVAVVSLASTAAAKAWSAKNVGLLWIDGDHRYESVRADYTSWSPFLIDEAIVALHDRSAPGVNRWLDELRREGKILPLGELDELCWFKLRQS